MHRYNTAQKPENSVHAIGNGKFLVYGLGANFYSMLGPSYSAPSYCSGSIISDEYSTDTTRLDMSNTWVHKITSDSSETVFTDAIDPEYNIFRRAVTHSGKPLSFKLNIAPGIGVYTYDSYDFHGKYRACSVLVMKKGFVYFTDESLQNELRMYILTSKEVSFDKETSVFTITGDGCIDFISDYADSSKAYIQACLAVGGIDVIKRSGEYFEKFLNSAEKLPSISDPELNSKVTYALQSVAVLIKAQQSFDGGVTAGHFYPMAYVRDQSGVMRGLLSMGYIRESAAVLDFWYGKFKTFGNLHNAESMGHNNGRLVFSNDEVEVPAFVLLCCMLYVEKTGDTEKIANMLDMLNWCFTVQLKHIAHGMTGFSGDETYMAGFIFPREFIYHGSADSTLLFAECGRRFIDFARKNRLLSENILEGYEKAVKEVRDLYKENFLNNGLLYGNNPDRVKYSSAPRFHHGFCMVHQMKGLPAPLMWLERGEYDLFRCPECYKEHIELIHDPEKRYILSSAALLPVYFKSDILSYNEIKNNAEFFFEQYNELGYIPSEAGSTRSLGYDYGLLLYNAVYLNNVIKEKILITMLDVLDPCGAWAEYYDRNNPYNCRCRPWESAINAEAIVEYCKNQTV